MTIEELIAQAESGLTAQFARIDRMEEIGTRRVLDAFREHQVAYYARKMNIQTSALCRLVKKESGHTVMEIINKTLIMDAKTQLRTENTSVKDIALSLGFNNAAFFNKFFKKHTGVTPQMFRNSMR